MTNIFSALLSVKVKWWHTRSILYKNSHTRCQVRVKHWNSIVFCQQAASTQVQEKNWVQLFALRRTCMQTSQGFPLTAGAPNLLKYFAPLPVLRLGVGPWSRSRSPPHSDAESKSCHISSPCVRCVLQTTAGRDSTGGSRIRVVRSANSWPSPSTG